MTSRKLVECVPNVSAGRDEDKIAAMAEAIRAVPGVYLLDIQSDPDHNRTVFTYVGPADPVVEAALRLAELAVKLIDLRAHRGEHPRMGALDVLPFVPVRGVTMGDCVMLARKAGAQIWERLGVPVYLYAEAATRPERQDLAEIRKGEFEGFFEKIRRREWAPDFGDPVVHPTAGVCAVGAREFLIAYNVNLGTSELRVAKDIAKAVRGSSGGLRYVKALGLELQGRGIVQVSLNLTDFRKTPIARVTELVRREAQRFGVPVVGTEIVGLVPEEALLEAAAYYLGLENYSPDIVLERKLAQAIES